MKLYWKIVIVILAVLVCVSFFIKTYQLEPVAAQRVAVSSGSTKAESLQNEFASVAERCSPAVVVIRTGRKLAARNYNQAYNQLYNYFNYGKVPEEQTVPTGIGSGFFVSADGYILTNYHIVRGQDVFTVKLEDEHEYNAELVGSDPLSDLAVLKVNAARQFPFLTFADSEKVKVGHWAIAIGAPFNLAHTVTVGIVSHKRRAMGMNVYENFIQTDASINQGNSGGPLLDLSGKVIGVNDFILSSSGGNIGLSFSIAGNLARRVCRKLIRDGKVIRPWLGVSMGMLSEKQKKQLNIEHGVIISGVIDGGPALTAGVMAGDIILEVDGKRINTPNDVLLAVFGRNPGEIIKLKLWREDNACELEVEAGTMPEIMLRGN